ncbi:PAS domain S-box protein [Coleofasciculus sp. FACHB-501]|uniref:PAS domain-containing sensor histidine kinase n=1 Tax=Cyanophyceae TaxID=3028117 RepID=UPI00168447B2|nr:PAS domain S-box protein [Coleofasciculus sp. FACHB-501]MBD1840669.1 PAS domain S-box protein [Coleofasciculus sp. FACHB-501]
MAIPAAESPITESSKVEAENNRFFTLSLDMFFIAGFDGYFKRLNPMCEKTLLFTSEEFLAKPWIAFIHPKDRESTLVQLQELSSTGETVTFENRFRCKDGTYKWLLWNAALCAEEQLIYAAARDITERKQAEEELRQSEERFRLLIKNVKDYAIYMLDTSGKVISWNKGAERLNGYQAEEIIGRHFSCFFPSSESRSGKPEQVLQKAALDGRCEWETLRLHQDGSQFWANVVVTALRGEDGRLRGFATITRDITERKRSQAALEQANNDLERRVEERTAELKAANELLKREVKERQQAEKALRQSEAQLREKAAKLKQALSELKQTQTQLIQSAKMSSLGQLVAGIAHEINNPVSFIYGNLDYAIHYIQSLIDLLQLYGKHSPEPPEEIQDLIDEIDLDFVIADMPKLLSSMKLGADRIRQIVASLRNFSRHDQAEKKSVNIHEGIDNTLRLLQDRLKATATHPAIEVVKEYGDLPLVECYAGQFNQVLMNILNNAIDALEEAEGPRSKQAQEMVSPWLSGSPAPQSCIRICTEVKDSDRIAIRIADNGPGMNEEVRRKLFDPFFTTKPIGTGTGLGLSISYQIVVEKHGGQLTCVSEPGKGAEFLIEIPIRQTRSEPALSRCA